MCGFISSTNFVRNIFNSKKTWARYDKNVYWYSYKSTRYPCPILMKIDFSEEILEKILSYQMSWKYVQWEPRISLRTRGETWRSKVKFRSVANEPNKWYD